MEFINVNAIFMFDPIIMTMEYRNDIHSCLIYGLISLSFRYWNEK